MGLINIDSGDAILGLGTSGTALSLMKAPKFVQNIKALKKNITYTERTNNKIG